MFARTLGIVLVGFALGAFGLEAAGQGKDKKDAVKDAPAKEVKKDAAKDKFEVPKNAVAGTIKSVDLKASSFTIAVKDGKDRTFGVQKDTEFFGPKGGDRGTGPDGLKDDTMAKGYEVKVVPGKDGKSAKEVHLPNRKAEKKAEEKKDKK